jgi:hypothetical protein
MTTPIIAEQPKYDMTKATFMFPIFIDFPERLRNLKIAVEWIDKHFDTNIMICEQKTAWIPDALKHIKHQYIHLDNLQNGLIHRTHQLNIMTHSSKTPIVVNIDCDVVLDPRQYIEAYETVLSNKADMVYPYNGKCVDIDKELIDQFKNEQVMKVFERKPLVILNNHAKGGVIFFNRNAYINGGLENERFVSWGFEDNERDSRFKKLGYRAVNTSGTCFHLNHPRSKNSSDKNPNVNVNENEYARISKLNRAQLQQEILVWPWTSANHCLRGINK